MHKGRSGQAEDVRDSRRSHRQGINERIERERVRERETERERERTVTFNFYLYLHLRRA